MNRVTTVHRSRLAMGTLFECVLVGTDEEHLIAVAEAALDEVERVERLLSRFDPRSEISRINRVAGREPVLVDRELSGLIEFCDWAWQATEGAFDITAGSGPGVTWAGVEWDLRQRVIHFRDDRARLDLGGIGKGYVLDRAAAIAEEHGVENALLHAGTSSVLGRGVDADGNEWSVRLADPWEMDDTERLPAVNLCDAALSISAARHGEAVSDLIDPHTGERLAEQQQVVVLGASGTETEVWSTALVVRPELMTPELSAAIRELRVSAWRLLPPGSDERLAPYRALSTSGVAKR